MPQSAVIERQKCIRTARDRTAAAEFSILFTCAGRRVALLREFRRALNELGLTGSLIASDLNPAASAMLSADHAELVPRASDPRYIPTLKELVMKHGVWLIVPTTDLDLLPLARHAPEFAEIGCRVLVASGEAIADVRDKLRFQDVVRRAGLRVIRSLSLADFLRDPFYPCFLKPPDGSGSVGSGRATNERELRAHVSMFGDGLMVQDYVPGAEYTIDVFRRRDGVVCAVVPRQRLAVRAGEVEKGITVNEPQLIEATIRLTEQMPGMWGVFCAQCRRPPGGEPHFFEANARFGGGAVLSIQAGVDLPKMLLTELLGHTVEPSVGRFTDRLMMSRYDEAVFTVIDRPDQLPGHNEPIIR